VAVCGRRRERFPDATIYNRMCDIEWDTPVGPARSCGGDAMIRAAALRRVGGYNPAVIAGEDDELCVRLRQAGGTLRRLDAEMTVHDAAMTRFGQWWRRAVRAGHCFAEGWALHGRPPERMWLRNNRSTILSALVVPALALGLVWPTRGWSLVLLAWYPLMFLRYLRANLRRGLSRADARLYSAFCVLAAFPQLQGQYRYVRSRLRGRAERIIEYKGVAE
jgi:GT2 family glycosyltransferase